MKWNPGHILVQKKLEVSKMWLNRKITEISCVDRITKEAVVLKMGKKKEVMNTAKRRKLECLRNIM
jgi:hypothetical protein